jgi:hypothetical protein
VLVRADAALGLQYEAHRRAAPGSCGSVWRSRTYYSGVSAARAAAFQLDAARRHEWDSGVGLFTDLAACAEAAGAPPTDDCALHLWRMRFPAPLAPRDYVTARRTWREARPGDSEPTLYIVSRAVADPLPAAVAAALPGGRAHRVSHYFAGLRVREVPGGCELHTVYYEDSGLKPSLVDWTVKRSLWGFVEKQALGLLAYQPGAAAAADSPRRPRRRLLQRAGGAVLTLAGAAVRGLAAAVAASPNAAQRQARREAARAATLRMPPPLAPLAALTEAARSRVHPLESLHRRASAGLGAAKQHVQRENARRAARERERRRREVLALNGAPAPPALPFTARVVISVAAAVALRLLRRGAKAERF